MTYAQSEWRRDQRFRLKHAAKLQSIRRRAAITRNQATLSGFVGLGLMSAAVYIAGLWWSWPPLW